MRTRFFPVVILTAALLASASAGAEDKRSPLEGQPAIRHRQQLRKMRFEIGPSANFSLNRSLRHSILVGAKAEFHFTDMLSLGAEFGYGVAFDTALTGEVEKSYESTPEAFKALHNRFADISLAGDVRAVFTPLSGKMGIFGKLFMGYDFYGFAGFGWAMMKNNVDQADVDAANEGFRPGFAWGLGMHLFFNRWVAMGIEVKDLIFGDNDSGGDLTRGQSENELLNPTKDPEITAEDRSTMHHFFVGLNVTFFLPPSVDISE